MSQQPSNTFHIEVSGRPLPDDVARDLVAALVEDSLHLPDLFVLRFRDADRTLLQRAGIEIGAPVTISVVSDASPSPQRLMSGEVTALEADFSTAGSFKVVRGFDQSHRLFRGRTSETYKNVTYADVAKTVAARNGLKPGTVDPTPVVHELVAQANSHDWQLLKGLADEIGFEVAVAEGRLHFRKPSPSAAAPDSGDLQSQDPLQLTLGSSLLTFTAQVTSAEQVSKVQVRGWDLAQKRALVSSEPAQCTSATLDVDPAGLAAKFGSPTYVAVDTPFVKQSDVDASARAVARQVAGGFAEFEGTSRGNPKLRVGSSRVDLQACKLEYSIVSPK